MKIFNAEIKIKTKKVYNFIEITGKVKDIVKISNIKDGLVNLQILHTSSSIVMNECDEPLLVKDLVCHLEKVAPQNAEYHHDNFEIRTVNMCDDECDNGHSHCKAFFLPSTITLNLLNKELQLGTYQKIFLLELDRSRPRTIQVHIIGE